ncbi:transporter [Alkalihalobacillus alcalophilus ATCC 27647 = CGMCC 1.3604]|uniref:Transporter n=2 Tax=Alkalihalobacillus alcalophilus ATCC 27647 = CGMCC 1.3604 TaxID=1218173 RepID=A0A4S4K266_ALKAL|nr:SCO family protein [Alkalihalobacillus alcalophilus]THG90079.1 transporter [Alkalihalobacillus alcalophilus ATCC 27647 = CGMCC 1.3604]
MMKQVITGFVLLFVLSGCGWLYELGGSNMDEQYDYVRYDAHVPDFSFVNQNGESFGTNELEGHYYLANMIFTYCTTVCPTMTPNMQNLQAELEGDGIDIQFVTFTVDPERDTPEHLKGYGTNVGANLETWHFLSGYEQDEIADFSREAFKASVQPMEDDIAHSTAFYLVNKEGQVIRSYNGMQPQQEPIIEDIKAAIEQEM